MKKEKECGSEKTIKKERKRKVSSTKKNDQEEKECLSIQNELLPISASQSINKNGKIIPNFGKRQKLTVDSQITAERDTSQEPEFKEKDTVISPGFVDAQNKDIIKTNCENTRPEPMVTENIAADISGEVHTFKSSKESPTELVESNEGVLLVTELKKSPFQNNSYVKKQCLSVESSGHVHAAEITEILKQDTVDKDDEISYSRLEHSDQAFVVSNNNVDIVTETVTETKKLENISGHKNNKSDMNESAMAVETNNVIKDHKTSPVCNNRNKEMDNGIGHETICENDRSDAQIKTASFVETNLKTVDSNKTAIHVEDKTEASNIEAIPVKETLGDSNMEAIYMDDNKCVSSETESSGNSNMPLTEPKISAGNDNVSVKIDDNNVELEEHVDDRNEPQTEKITSAEMDYCRKDSSETIDSKITNTDHKNSRTSAFSGKTSNEKIDNEAREMNDEKLVLGLTTEAVKEIEMSDVNEIDGECFTYPGDKSTLNINDYFGDTQNFLPSGNIGTTSKQEDCPKSTVTTVGQISDDDVNCSIMLQTNLDDSSCINSKINKSTETQQDTDDISDSQLCSMDWVEEFKVPDKYQKKLEPQSQDGTTIIRGLIKELSQLNTMILRTKRELETARRQLHHGQNNSHWSGQSTGHNNWNRLQSQPNRTFNRL